jgi:hypothetical protein
MENVLMISWLLALIFGMELSGLFGKLARFYAFDRL